MANMNKNRISNPGAAVYPVLPDADAAKDKRPTAEQLAKKAPVTYRATARGYVNGTIVDAGDVFSTNAPKGSWMEPIGKSGSSKASRLADAVDDTQSPLNDDPALETFSLEALQAEALRLGLTDASGLSQEDLIVAIRAAYVNEAQ